VAYIDPFSAPFASGGDEFLKVFSYILTRVNADGGALGKKFEIVPFDDKRQPAETLIALKNVTDQKNPLCYAMQRIERWCRAGSMVFPSINARNPDNRILYLNCGELATERTNESATPGTSGSPTTWKCAAAQVRALRKDVTKVYLLNQDYLFGQSV
jgi:branched-chain amino acid transport system substrate-binding protein